MLLLSTAPASLERAKAHYSELQVQQCVTELENSPRPSAQTESAEYELYLGLCRFHLHKEEQAGRHLQLALQLNPALMLPAHTSPKIQAVWDRLRHELGLDRPVLEPPRRPALAVMEVPAPAPPTPRRWGWPVGLASAAVASTALATVFGVLANGQASLAAAGLLNDDFQARIIASNTRAQQWATGANIAWVTAGIAATAAIVSLLLELRR